MIEKKKPSSAAPEIRRYVRNRKGSTDGREAVSAVPARRVIAGHKEPRTRVSPNLTREDIERLAAERGAIADVTAHGAVKTVTYYRPPEAAPSGKDEPLPALRDLTNVRVFGGRGEVSAWLKAFLAGDEAVTEAVCHPRTVRRALAIIAGTVKRKKGPMGKRGRQRWITPNPTAEQFRAAVAKLGVTVENVTSATHKTDKAVRVRKIQR